MSSESQESHRATGHQEGTERPLGNLPAGEAYYAPVGAMRYDGDQAQCHLCGRWMKLVGGSHIMNKHGITAAEYRDMFHLNANVSTACPELSEHKRQNMIEQIATGERDQSALGKPSPPTVGRWRSLGTLHPDLLKEWHADRNGERDPFSIGQRSRQDVWWRCSTCKHEWQASPNSRTSKGTGCPQCARRRIAAACAERGRNFLPASDRTLAAKRPDLLAEWHPTRNPGLDPSTVAAGSDRKVWWRCSTDGCQREWQAVVRDRARRGLGCPACGWKRAGQRRARATPGSSLADLQPKLLAEWHPTRNEDLDPYTIKPGSERRLWWLCSYCGHEWQSPPYSRRDSPAGGCPTCATRLARGVKLDRAEHRVKPA